MTLNVGGIDRIARIVLGLVLIGLTLTGTIGVWGWLGVVPLATGAIATLAGMFPAIAMQLLGFVAIYGMILMPMGAIIFVDFWLLEKIGLKQNYAEARGIQFYWVPLVTWVTVCSICSWLALTGKVGLFFVSLPGWFAAAALYIVLSQLAQKKVPA